LSRRFDPNRAEQATLIWVEIPGTGQRSRPFPILVDRSSGIIQGSTRNGTKGYGFVADVQGCIHHT
jgi:hypothetical protein